MTAGICLIASRFFNNWFSSSKKPLFITSRRTPKALEERLINEQDSPYSVFYHAEQRRGKFHHLLYVANHIFVTEDSSTMISEAVSSGKSVISVYPQSIKTPKKYSDIIDKYQRLNFVERRSLRIIQTTDSIQDRDISNTVSKALKDFQTSLMDRLQLD